MSGIKKGRVAVRPYQIRILLFIFFLLCAGSCLSQTNQTYTPASLPEANLKSSSIAVFKNGLGFFVRLGSAKLASGEAVIPMIPDAALGTLWLAPNDPGTSLEELVAYRYKTAKEHKADSLQDLLRINPGKKMTITFNGKEYAGQVLELSGGNHWDQRPQPVSSNRTFMLSNVSASVPSQLLLFKTDSGVLGLNPGAVQLVSMGETPNLSFQQEEEARALRFRIKGAGQTSNLTMGYLQKGIGWTPSYLVSLQDEKSAHITMQAVLTNDVEDISGAEVVFVVGVPNFRFADMWSPMALRQSLAEFLQSATAQRDDRNQFANALVSQMTMREDMASAARLPGDFSANVEEPQGAPEEDLFLYKRTNVTLAKGERATYNLFAADVPFEHLYEWEVIDNPRVDVYGNPVSSYGNNQSPEKFANVVWHSLRLKNNTKFPWTSGPGMVISGVQALSQDTLVYTPKGASTDLKMTVATDVRVDKKELEVGRAARVLQRDGNNYDAVTVEGTLKLKNFKAKDIRLVITRSFVGEVVSMTGDGHVEKLADVIRQMNPTSRVTWDLAVKAGEDKTITYRYKILIRE